MNLILTHKNVTMCLMSGSLAISENLVNLHADAGDKQAKQVSVVSKANGWCLFVKLNVFQIMLIFPDAEHIVTILCLWFRFTRLLRNA